MTKFFSSLVVMSNLFLLSFRKESFSQCFLESHFIKCASGTVPLVVTLMDAGVGFFYSAFYFKYYILMRFCLFTQFLAFFNDRFIVLVFEWDVQFLDFTLIKFISLLPKHMLKVLSSLRLEGLMQLTKDCFALVDRFVFLLLSRIVETKVHKVLVVISFLTSDFLISVPHECQDT